MIDHSIDAIKNKTTAEFMISGNLTRKREQIESYSHLDRDYLTIAENSRIGSVSEELPKLKIVQTKQRNSQGISLLLYIWRQTRMVNIYGFPSSLKQTIIRSFIASVLGVMGVICGTVPEFSWQPLKLSFNYLAYTQEFNDTQIINFAKAVLEIENRRQAAYQEIQKIIGRTPPNILCHQRETFKGLPREAQTIAVNYCNQSKQIVENSGLTVRQFNDLTVRVQSDQELKRRVQNAMIRLRKDR